MKNPFSIIKGQNLHLPSSVIQVGASGGQEIDEFVSNGVVDALLIEPLEVPFLVLSQRVVSIPNYVPIRALAYSRNGIELDFHVSDNGGMSSSILPPKRHLDIYPSVSFPETCRVVGYRLDDIVKSLYNSKSLRQMEYEMLYLDVQGAELHVLRGSSQLIETAKYIYTEVGTGDGYRGGASY
jgi:FkbM family methyltransferase